MKLLHCSIYYVIIGVLAFAVGRLLPKKRFISERFPYRPFGFEKSGAVYGRPKIKVRQDKAPDMSEIPPGLMPAKKIGKACNFKNMEIMLRETCVAKFTRVTLFL